MKYEPIQNALKHIFTTFLFSVCKNGSLGPNDFMNMRCFGKEIPFLIGCFPNQQLLV